MFHPDDDNLAQKCSIFTKVLSATVTQNTGDQRTSALKKNLILKVILPDDFSSP